MWDRFPLLPMATSEYAQNVDHLYWALIGVASLIILGIFFTIIYFSIKYNKFSNVDRFIQDSATWKLEAIWISIPLIVCLVFFVWAARLYYSLYLPPKNTPQIFVIGQQWMWKIQHPSGEKEINESGCKGLFFFSNASKYNNPYKARFASDIFFTVDIC